MLHALISHERHGSELAELLHRGDHVSHAHQHLHAFIRDLVTKAAQEGTVRKDIPTDELATYCVHAVTAASGLPTKAAVRRLITVILSGLNP